MCCIKITYELIDGESGVIEVQPIGEFNDFNTYEFEIDGTIYFIWHNATDDWYVTTSPIGDISDIVTGIKSNVEECPLASIPIWNVNEIFEQFTTEKCDACPCLSITIETKVEDVESQTYFINQTSIVNGLPAFEFNGLPLINSQLFLCYSTLSEQWFLTSDGFGGSTILGGFTTLDQCASGSYKVVLENEFNIQSIIVQKIDCECGAIREDRQQFQFNSIRFPEIFIEQNRGLKDCCCKLNVLSGTGNISWQNDKTSAWIKLSDFADTATFILKKHGVVTNYTPSIQAFPNEPNAFYTTIEWKDVLILDGVGCYELEVEFNISGAIGSFTWGIYNLQPYTIQNALKTARIRAKFNGYHENEGIDFTGANVESTHRFYGFIGFRQPNTEIDNIIYSNREMKRVIRENLNEYEIITDPSDECIIKPMIDLYLLSENELFISDYNAHNHSYRYLDVPVIVQESPTVEYKDFSRKAVLTCKVADKFKNQRTYYNG